MTRRCFQRDRRYFHLNTGLNDRIWAVMHRRERWKYFAAALFKLQREQDFTAHAFVLLDTHFHLLFSTAALDEDLLARHFHEILNGLINQTWDALHTPLFCEPVPGLTYYRNAYKYIYRNPIEAGLCFRAEDYEYSSLHWLLGRGAGPAPVIDNMGLVFAPVRILDWLNHAEAELTPRFRPH